MTLIKMGFPKLLLNLNNHFYEKGNSTAAIILKLWKVQLLENKEYHIHFPYDHIWKAHSSRAP